MEENLELNSDFTHCSSDITHCAESASESNKDIDCVESDVTGDCVSAFDSDFVLSVMIDTCQLFKQLAYARLGFPPYNKYKKWNDIKLWEEIADNLRKGDRVLYYGNEPTVSELLRIVSQYLSHFLRDPQLNILVNDVLKHDIFIVFGDMIDKREPLNSGFVDEVMVAVSGKPADGETIQSDRPKFPKSRYWECPSTGSESSDKQSLVVGWDNSNPALEKLVERASKMPRTSSERASKMPRTSSTSNAPSSLIQQYGQDVVELNLQAEQQSFLLTHLDGGIPNSYVAASQSSDFEVRKRVLLKLLKDIVGSSTDSSIGNKPNSQN